MDEDGNPKHVSFKNLNKKLRVPFVVYTDCKCLTESINTCTTDESKSYTKQYQKHKPSGFCYLIKCFDDELFTPKLEKYTGESPDDNISQRFVDSLESDIKRICKTIKPNKFLRKTLEDDIAFKNATHCHICEGELANNKVMDHCHFTGRYRGAAHNECNLAFEVPKFFPVLLHNLSGYDAHLFIKSLNSSEGKISCIPNNEEKYISFTKEIVVGTYKNKEGKQKEDKRDIRFIDSFRFMATGLGSLAFNLPKEAFKNLAVSYEGEQFELLFQEEGCLPI